MSRNLLSDFKNRVYFTPISPARNIVNDFVSDARERQKLQNKFREHVGHGNVVKGTADLVR